MGCYSRSQSDAYYPAKAALRALPLPDAEYHWAAYVGSDILLKATWAWQDASRRIKRHMNPMAITAAIRLALQLAEAVCGTTTAPVKPKAKRRARQSAEKKSKRTGTSRKTAKP